MPITIIGKSRSRAIFKISTNGKPTTIIFSMSTSLVSSPSSTLLKLVSACSFKRALMSSLDPIPAMTAALINSSSITCNNVRSPSGAAIPIATLSAFTEHGEKSIGTSMSDDFRIAMIYEGLGQKDKAVAWFDKAFEGRSEELLFLKIEPVFDSLRDDPRYQALVRRIGLTP